MRVGAQRGDFGQRAVVQDDVGRDVLLARLLRAPQAQLLEERCVAFGEAALLGARRARDADALALAAHGLPAQGQGGFALEHRACRIGQLERAVGVGVGFEQAGGEQLAEDRAPAHVVEIGADAEGRQAVVAELLDLVGRLAAQDVDQVSGTEALAGAQRGGQRFLRGDRAVPDLRRIDAYVAVAAGLRLLAEIVEQYDAPALRRFAVGEHGVKLLALDALLLVGRVGVLDHLAVDHHVVQPVGHPALGGLAVASGAPGFLVIGLEALRQVEVGDEAHVGLVDAHAEGDGRDHDDAVLAQEALLVALARLRVEPGVVGQGADPLLL